MMFSSFGRGTGGWLNFARCNAITPHSSRQRVSREASMECMQSTRLGREVQHGRRRDRRPVDLLTN